jgi:tetratricopeptide (TPR) repeat protein
VRCVLALGPIAALVLSFGLATTSAAQEAPAEPTESAPPESVPTESAPPAIPPDAAERLAQGEALFDAGNYLAALAEFQSAYDRLEGHPERFLVLFNIGQAHERLFHYDEALTFYQRYLDEGGANAEGADEVRGSMRSLEGLLGTIVITADVASATVWVDGHEVGTAPGSIRVPSGRHDVELRAEGRVPSAQEVQVAARERIEVSFTLAVLQDYDGIEPTVFFIVAGSAAAILLAGAGVGIFAIAESERFDGGVATDEDKAYVADLALAADITFLVGAAAAIGAVVLAFLTDWDGPRRDEDPAGASVRAMPIVGPSFAGLALSVDF